MRSTQRSTQRSRDMRSDGQVARQRLVDSLPITERQVSAAEMDTEVWEGGDGPPILFLQGEFAVVWMRVIPELVATNRVIVPDLPGLGEPAPPAGPFGLDSLLEWLDDLVTLTCASPPVVVGKGAGGALAARFAVDHSDRLAGLVLVDSHGLGRYRPPPAMALSFLRVLVRPTERSLERSFRAYCFTDLDTVRSDAGPQWEWLTSYALDRFRTPQVRAAMRRLMPRLSKAIPPEDLDRITAPTTLIWGRHDVGVPLEVAEAAAARHGWELHIIDDARDDPALEQPAAFLSALRAAAGLRPRRNL